MLDSRALSPDLENFSDVQDYTSNNSIVVGNKLGLLISLIGTMLLKTQYESIPLKNTLCVSQLKKKLLSIQSFAKEANCEFLLNKNGFAIKEMSGRKLLTGTSNQGLYHLNDDQEDSSEDSLALAFSIRVFHRRYGHLSVKILDRSN